jgi:hypothetical protein
MWDGGWADNSHTDLSGRIILGDSGSSTAFHATHVAGIIGGNGKLSSSLFRGIAPNVTIRSYEWPETIGELDNETLNAINAGSILSQNSWGYNIPGFYPCSYFGDYDYKRGFGKGNLCCVLSRKRREQCQLPRATME